MSDYDSIILETADRVGTLTLNRPESLNALSYDLMIEVTTAVAALDADPDVGAIVIAGSDRAFAAGADIKEMQAKGFTELFLADWLSGWDALTRTRTPLIAAVAGYALGGGCELAMMCDLIIAADTARFGQPEVKLGIPPGIGGTQRLTRAIGKSKAMEMCLTGRLMDADEAERSGLVCRVVPAAELHSEAHALATTIAGMSATATMLIKDCVNRAFESNLTEGVGYERRSFHAAFATPDQKEGMTAFIEKRAASFNHH